MGQNQDSSITGHVILTAIVDIALLVIASMVEDIIAFLLVVAAVIVFIIEVARIRKILAEREIEEIAERLRAKEEAEANLKAVSVMNFGGSNKATSGVGGIYFEALRALAKECAAKMQRQSYASYNSLQDIIAKLNVYAFSRGIKLNENTAEALLMAMVSSRCIFVKKTSENTEDILSVIGEFFSGVESPCIDIFPTPIKPTGLFYSYQDNVLKETEFFKRIYAASFFNNSVYTCTIRSWEDMQMSYVFSDFIRYFKNPEGFTACTLPQVNADNIPNIKDKKFKIPNNLWLFVLINGNEPLPKDAALWASEVEVGGVGVKTEAKLLPMLPMAYSQLDEIVEGAFDEYFLPLDTWKKLDKVEEYLASAIPFKIDNVLARQIERLTTMLVACGNTPAQAIDAALSQKILPLLSGYTKEQIDHEGTTLKELLDGLFGSDAIPASHKVLCALQLE